MSEWREVTLGELISVKHGYAFKGEFFATAGDEIVLTPGNFQVGGGLQFRDGKERYYTGSYPSEFLLSPRQLLVVMTDLKQDAPLLGSPAFVPLRPPVLHNQRLGLVERKAEADLDESFLYYVLVSDDYRQQLRATATGTTVRHTAPSRIYDVQVRLPGLREQEVIGKVLRSIDDLIENNRRRVELLEEMARAVYREWFVHFRYPGHEDIPLVDSELGPIPEGWEVRTVGHIAELMKGSIDPKERPNETPAVGLEHLPRHQLTLDAWGVAEGLGSRKSVFFRDDILFGKIRPYFHKVSVAPFDGICSTDALVLRSSGAHWGQALMEISSNEFVANATQTSNGTKMPRANWSVIKEFQIPMAPDVIGEEYTGLAHDLVDQARALMLQARALTTLRDLLLPRLVSGRIDVSDLDLDLDLAEEGAA
jgi:type I restriction enzyme S subunit